MGAPGERKQRGGCCPPLVPAQRPHLGALSLAAGHAAAPGGAGRRKRRGRLPPQMDHRRGALPPSSREIRGALPPCNREREGVCPPLWPRTGAQVGPWLPTAAGRAPAAPEYGVAPATPKRRGEGENWVWVFCGDGFGDLVVLVGGVVEELGVMGGGEELGG